MSLKKKISLIDNQRGFSVIEIITTIVFIAIAFPAILQLYTYIFINSSVYEIEARAIMLCNQKMEEIAADKISPSRGYGWVVTSGRYPSENVTGGFVRTVTIDTTGKYFSGVSYAEAVVTVTHDLMPTVQLKNWFTHY